MGDRLGKVLIDFSNIVGSLLSFRYHRKLSASAENVAVINFIDVGKTLAPISVTGLGDLKLLRSDIGLFLGSLLGNFVELM